MLLSPKTAAAHLGISVDRVRKLIASGQLKAEDIGLDRPLWAIEETELARFAALDRPHGRPRRIVMQKYFTYDTNGYVGEGFVDTADVATPEQRAALLTGLQDGLLRLIYTNGGGDSYANDYDQGGQEVERPHF